MLKSGKTGLLRQVLEVIFGRNVINRHFFSGIHRHFFNVICGLRPANLVTNHSFTSVSLPDVIRQSRSTGQSTWMTLKRSIFSQDFQNRLCITSGDDYKVEQGEVLKHLFRVIHRHFFNVIRGLRPANLDHRIKSGDDNRVVQYGRSMIEMLGVLAIIGVLSVGGIAGYSKAMIKWKTNKTIEQTANIINDLTTLILNQKQLRGTSDEYPDEIYSSNPEDMELFKTLGVIDEEMLVDGRLKNPFGGDFYLYIEDNAVSIDIYDLPREACMAIATTIWGSKFDIAVNKDRWLGVYIPELCYYGLHSEVREGATLGCYHDGGVPLTPDKAVYGCSCEEASCAIEIYFKKFI